VVRCLLIVPFPESALNESAGKMFMEDYEEYFKHAKMLTELYAKPKELKMVESNVAKEKPSAEEEKGSGGGAKKENEAMKKKWMKRI
jgi:ubiquitin-conjugating enzyme E2 S